MKNIIYGIHAVTSALERQPHSILQLWCQQGRTDKKVKRIQQLAEQTGIKTQIVPSNTLDKLCQAGRHQGVLAEINQAESKTWREADLPELLAAAERPLLLILDGVEDPHNLGACLRSADASGATCVIAPKDNAVGITATVRKTACGAAETVPFIQVTNLARTLNWLKQEGVWLYGFAGEASQSLFVTELTGAIGLVLGAEAKGLRRLTREACDHLVSIPMQGSVESLNVSVATAVGLFEVVRQRQV